MSPPAPLIAVLLLASATGALAQDTDTDGDGLSDFQEVRKYRTDPAKADSDGDGTPDGDWNERREWTYSVRTIVRVMPPAGRGALGDDWQDARVLEDRPDYVELEVVHYPLATAGEGIEGDPDWRRERPGLRTFLDPGPSTNWDPKMREEILGALAAAGVATEKATDRDVVAWLAPWVLRRGTYLDRSFTTYFVHFPGGKPAIFPGLETAFDRGKGRPEWTAAEQMERDSSGRDMFEKRCYGSCTSTAVLLTTALRAAAIPTRMVLCIPAVDASDARQVGMIRTGLTHHGVRQKVLRGLSGLGDSFAAHTMNEVFVGGRWRRLNCSRLGQGILDPHLMGLLTHVQTFRDLADADLARGWGARYAKGERSPALAGPNPYATLGVSDLFGRHARIENPEPEGHAALTIGRVYWFHSAERPRWIGGDDIPRDQEGHLLAHVEECRECESVEQYGEIYGALDKEFVLRAEGRPDVAARAERGMWMQEFYLRIPAEELARMDRAVPYTLHARNGARNGRPGPRWVVKPGVTLVRE
ncbi:MAG: thrombospondin type 3 repeat-containing protein [Planctomycetales bacterium]|nr:thrombospondin type 3 repeat-containing protein [Planctomycetales bacterium]